MKYLIILTLLTSFSFAQSTKTRKSAKNSEKAIDLVSASVNESQTGKVIGMSKSDSALSPPAAVVAPVNDAFTAQMNIAIDKYKKSKIITMSEENIKGSYKISVAYYKTSHILFPFAIKYFDVGSDRVLATVAEGMNSVLKLKANQIDNFETNVTVITGDGKFYSFIVSYSEEPLKLNINMAEAEGKVEQIKPEKSIKEDKIIFTDTYYTEKDLSLFAKKVIDNANIKHIVDKNGKVVFKVSALQSKDANIFINVKIINNSPLDYDIETLKFFVRDVEKNKKELTQEVEVKPVFAYIMDKKGNIGKKLCVTGSEYNFCFMLPKFVITDDKNLDVDVRENNGGRNSTLTIDYDTFYYDMIKL